MNFIVVEGYLGSGKTLGGTILANYYQEISGCALYSNFGMKGAKEFKTLEDFKEIAKESSSILVLDEAHTDLDARSFSSNHVKFMSQISFYLRKLRCTLILTSPLFENLDSRIRGITNVLMHVSKDSKYFYYSMYDIQSDKPLRTMKINKEKALQIAPSLYETHNMVTPVEMPSKKDEFNLFLEQLIKVSDDYYKELSEESA